MAIAKLASEAYVPGLETGLKGAFDESWFT
jgi:hypothetical protein